MRKSLLLLALVLVGWSVKAQDCGPYAFRSFNIADSTEMKGSGADTFSLSQAYPTAAPAKTAMPWDKTDFRRGSGGFMKQVLDYCWEGMDSAKWAGQNNKVRQWYNAPWLDHGYAGREFVHGLRMDYTSAPRELHPKQEKAVRNYSITYYNDIAAYALGQVWCNPAKPDPSKAKFPVGSVWFKLVFTTADTASAPYLLNPMEWDAFVETGTENPMTAKRIQKVRLLEVDFGVRMGSPDAVNGWVYGVYVYSGQRSGATAKDRLVPLGLQWGNDPGLTPAAVRSGEKPITECWINTTAWNESEPQSSLVQKIGWGYRLQGPVGNHSASIMSQNMTAGWPPAPYFPPANTPADSMLKWHRNLPSGTPFEAGQVSLDYCLELMEGLRNHAIAGGDSAMAEQYKEELSEMLGFTPVPKGQAASEEEGFSGPVEEGLDSARNMFVFVGFILLVLVLVGLLVWNFLKK